ncbi:MAG: hypothetical protein GEU75_10780 [Dehalococcoidia bacterium]|nr:hypothetical protein [Dehalococcoidia bacterium]
MLILAASTAHAEGPEPTANEAFAELVFAGAPLASPGAALAPADAQPPPASLSLSLVSTSSSPAGSPPVDALAVPAVGPAPQIGPEVAPLVGPDIDIPNPLDLLSGLDPRKWAGDILNAVLNEIGKALLEAMRGFVDWAMGLGDSSLNFVTQTPAEGTYESTTVRTLWDFSRALVNVGLAVILMWGGFNVMMKEQTRSPYHEVMELLPRVILAALAANLTLEFVRFLIDANNAFSAAVGQVSLPGYDAATPTQEGIALIFTALAYGIVAILLVFQMLMRLALIDMLIVLAPIATLLWVLPQTQGFARWWADLLPITVFQQAIQMMVLRLGTALMVELTPGSLSNALLTLLLGIAVCWLTLKVPSLLRSRNSQASFWNVATLVVATRVMGAVAASRGGGAGAAGGAGRTASAAGRA